MSKRPLLAAVGLIGVGIVFGVMLMTSIGGNAIQDLFAMGAGDLGAKSAPVTVPPSVKALNDQFTAVSDAVTKSVVSIAVKVDGKASRRELPEWFKFFGPEGDEEFEMPGSGEQNGSGVIISSDGYIVTNNHVVEGAQENGIRVTLSDQRELKARLVGTDPLTDLAVIKIEGNGFPAAHFAERKDVRVGEWVLAVGSPLGLKSTITAGIISAEGRGIGIVGSNQLSRERNRYAVENFIQTDAAINPGNSGGGLFNMAGSLVGINTAIASRSGRGEGYGFAIPIDMVRSVASDLIDDGRIERGYIGVEITSVDETTAKTAGLDKVSGVFVAKVVKGGAGEAAGLQEGDVILDVDGTPVRTSNDLQNQIVLRRAGDRVNLRVVRDGKQMTKTVTLKALDGSIADASSARGKAGDSDESGSDPVNFKDLGFTVGPLTEKARTDVDVSSGVLITKIDNRGVVARRGLREGSVIVKVDGKSVNSPSELKKILGSKKAGDGVLFIVQTKDGRTAVAVEVPEEQS